MSTRYKFFDNYSYYFVTFAVVEWIDVFTRDDYRKIVVDSLNHCIRHKSLTVYGWVLMTNHVHLIVSLSENASHTLSDVMRDMKKFTAMHLIKSIKENPQESRKGWMMSMFEKAGRQNSNKTVYQFWQQDNHPVQLKDENRFSRALDYVHNNPVASGIVRKAEDFPWSSAADYCGGKSAVDVVIY